MAAANLLLLLASASREEAFLPVACALAASVAAFIVARAVQLDSTLGDSALFNIVIHERVIKDVISYGIVIDFHDDKNFIVDPAAFSELDLWNDFKEGLLDCGLVLNMS